LQELFEIKARTEKGDKFRLRFECYMVELYMDKLIDMFDPYVQKRSNDLAKQNELKKLEIREDQYSNMIYIQGVKQVQVNSKEEALSLYQNSIKGRKVFGTDMNEQSSRSHVIFSVIVESINNETGQKFKGKLSFIDLAGSEKLDKANKVFNKDRLKESNTIN
jgi:hypothetical protein